MIESSEITNFNRSEEELQEFFLFCACVAGKTAVVQAKKLELFLQPAWLDHLTPFEYIDRLSENEHLRAMVCDAKLGQYDRLTEIFKQCTSLNLDTVTTTELEKLPGIGPKTSRFFILHTRPDQELAVLDTHILAWLGELHPTITMPRATPQSSSRYKMLEELFLSEAKSRKVSAAKLDLEIWNERSTAVA